MAFREGSHRTLALPPLPRLATPRGFDLLRVGVGLQPVATIATYLKKLSKKKTLRKFSVLGGIGGKPACHPFPAHGVLRAMKKPASSRALY
jgi:hypothetical protein